MANDVYRTPDDRFAGLPDFPFAPHYVEIDELRTHYLDEGRGEPMLLLHGEPTWSFLYRRMIPALRARFRCIAPDYIGFGRSDKLMKVGSYSFAFHYERLERFADALGLTGLTVVVQDWGGPLGLRYATMHRDRVARLIILNTGLMSGAPATLSPGLLKWREYALHPDHAGCAGRRRDSGHASGVGVLGQARAGLLQRLGSRLSSRGGGRAGPAHTRGTLLPYSWCRPFSSGGKGPGNLGRDPCLCA